jgi:hypothetical protein
VTQELNTWRSFLFWRVLKYGEYGKEIKEKILENFKTICSIINFLEKDNTGKIYQKKK